MIRRLLIANRGEIACRIVRTARRMGIHTVAVHSEADAGALHVRMADEAHLVGPAPSGDSYLAIDRILSAAEAACADAIHPGYGFLSENADFAAACEAAGIVFVGPPVAAIRAMGSKREAKDVMAKAGVPVVPDYRGDDQSAAAFAKHAARIGYPVLLKPAFGGGGKGMRRVDSEGALAAALAAAKREAASSFGDDTIIAEKFLDAPRHIEVQVFADSRGSVVHLHERDCSLQRRHQKIVEEAPAPSLDDALRVRIADAAVAAARAIGYVNAGTVEFLLDAAADFYFMEMNTRLQVEHPVTEAIAGLDLVEWQLRVAAGEPLPLAQDAIPRRGHAIEARIYAEAPHRGFMPSPGKVRRAAFPSGEGVRVDTGVLSGDTVQPWYDPMIAKLVVHGATREEARRRLAAALIETRLDGIETNVAFLLGLVHAPAFIEGRADVQYVDRRLQDMLIAGAGVADGDVALALAALMAEESDTVCRAPWQDRSGWQLNLPRGRWFHFATEDRAIDVRLALHPDGRGTFSCSGRDDEVHDWEPIAADPPGVACRVDGDLVQGLAWRAGAVLFLIAGPRVVRLDLVDPLGVGAAAETGGGAVVSPVPGKVAQVLAVAGDQVAKGAPLVVIEAMKMEHTLRAAADSKVVAVHCAAGDFVAEATTLVELETGSTAGF